MLSARPTCAPAAHQRRRRRPAPAAAAVSAAKRGSPPPSRPRPPPCPPSAPSLHAAREALADRLLEALADEGADDDEGATVARVRGLVLEAAGALRASRDWPRLEAALHGAGRVSGVPGGGRPPLFVAAGLGSLGGYRARLREEGAGRKALDPGARRRACPRAGMRLLQLGLARLLLLERGGAAAAAGGGGGGGGGGEGDPQFFASCAADPDYDALDLALVSSLGFSAALRGTVGEGLRAAAAAADVAAAAADAAAAAAAPDAEVAADANGASPPGAPSPPPPAGCLAYMPLCPRDAYDEILEAYWSPESLPNLAILGTSFGAQGESAALIAALSAFGGGGGGGGGNGGGGGGGNSGGGGGPGPGLPGLEAPEPPSERQALLAASPDHLLVETPAPDFACHGVGVALHTFVREAAAGFFAAAATVVRGRGGAVRKD